MKPLLPHSSPPPHTQNDNKDIFASIDGGATWSRPQCVAPPLLRPCLLLPAPPSPPPCCRCDDPSNCGSGCVLGGCRLQTPDPNGTCSSGNWSACYVLPDYPVYPGESLLSPLIACPAPGALAALPLPS